MIKFLYAKIFLHPYPDSLYRRLLLKKIDSISVNLIMTSKTAPLRYTTQNLVQRIVDRLGTSLMYSVS